MSEEPRRRSRFDDADSEPKRFSRFDRRSRSPAPRSSENARSRSPMRRDRDVDSSHTGDTKQDPAAAAAAAAARINAKIQAQKGPSATDVPPTRSSATPVTAQSPSASASASNDVYTQDGDFIKDIEVNDFRNRYTLTKGSTQKMIKEETGADVTTRGSFYPDKKMATATNPPLYLHITSQTKEGLDKAVAKINELMQVDLPNLIDERRFRRREPDPVERDELGRRKWPEERIPIDLEPIPGFNLRAQVVGQQGAYVKHIQQETRCRVQIKGRGSGFTDASGQESDEQMYLHVAGPDPSDVKRARDLCEDLLSNVKVQYEQFKERGPTQRGPRGGGGYNSGGYNQGRNNSYGSGYEAGYGGGQSPANAGSLMSPGGQGTPNTPGSAVPADYAASTAQYAQYYAQNPDQDPYAAYGGYDNYVNYYYQYWAQQQQGAGEQYQQATPGAAPGAPTQTPPQPSGSAPPPPPSSAPPSGGYSSVPPPPGM
ncbi:MAG: hypothetical protein M1820_000376 [Bogoriella megaspora]|nr:MAG: hypothetical protein M1820_000376 [Bogoriella megaspora]